MSKERERERGDSRDHIDGITGLRARLINLAYTNSCLCLSVCQGVYPAQRQRGPVGSGEAVGTQHGRFGVTTK